MSSLSVRKATEADIAAIHAMLEYYADQGIVLRRSREDILFYLRNFFVIEEDGAVRGCSAVRDFGNNLLEIRSLVIDPAHQGRGLGREIIRKIIRTVDSQRSEWRLFTLTGKPEFFSRLGFNTVPREMFPEKIWSDCRNCPKNTCCDEIALMLTCQSYRDTSLRTAH